MQSYSGVSLLTLHFQDIFGMSKHFQEIGSMITAYIAYRLFVVLRPELP